MEIQHPRRILAVSRPDSGLLDLVKGLTGTTPILPTETIAGTTHTWPIKTAYYTASVPIWLDEVSSPSAWSTEFLAPEAKEVLTVLGAFIVCFRKPVDEADLKAVKEMLECVGKVKEGCGYDWDGVCLAVAMPQSTTPYLEKSFEEWEDLCQDLGFEFVDFEAKGRNSFSEPMGLGRLIEALEANDWGGGDAGDADVDLEDFEDVEDEGEDEGSLGFGISPEEMQEEMKGMKQAIYGHVEEEDEGDEGVERLQAMMLKMQAVRDLGTDLPEKEKKRLAAKTVAEVMKAL